MGNLLNLTDRLKNRETTQKPFSNDKPSFEASVTDISNRRHEMVDEEKRELKRTLLTEFISMHAVVPGAGLMRVQLSDINEKGMAFETEEEKGAYRTGDRVELRIYLNHQTYFPLEVRVVHVKQNSEYGMNRHGCEFVSESLNQDALRHFIAFLETVTASVRRDKGDVLVSKINS